MLTTEAANSIVDAPVGESPAISSPSFPPITEEESVVEADPSKTRHLDGKEVTPTATPSGSSSSLKSLLPKSAATSKSSIDMQPRPSTPEFGGLGDSSPLVKKNDTKGSKKTTSVVSAGVGFLTYDDKEKDDKSSGSDDEKSAKRKEKEKQKEREKEEERLRDKRIKLMSKKKSLPLFGSKETVVATPDDKHRQLTKKKSEQTLSPGNAKNSLTPSVEDDEEEESGMEVASLATVRMLEDEFNHTKVTFSCFPCFHSLS